MISADFSAATWHKSSYSSNTTNCVEVAASEQAIGVRDSKNPCAATLVFTDTQWSTFLPTHR